MCHLPSKSINSILELFNIVWAPTCIGFLNWVQETPTTGHGNDAQLGAHVAERGCSPPTASVDGERAK